MKKKGSALLIVIIIMMITFVLAAIMVDISIKSNRVNSDTTNRTKAYYSAETGIYDFINYINSKGCNVSNGTSIANLNNTGGLYGDNMAVYKANITKVIQPKDTDDPKIYTYDIYSSGNYSSQGCTIVAEVAITYIKNINDGSYSYQSYSIKWKKVYNS
ncbi:hypothetical protein [Clostridium thailandense]|uniref:hypothetical protein n=1 Tax=Clostridium thailandense TaxID=2794346 RepID=UPI00398A1994